MLTHGFGCVLLGRFSQAAEREQALSNKCEGLQQQLVKAQSSISHLQADVRQRDDALAARGASNKQLSAQQQHLLHDKQELQQQATRLENERDAARVQAAAKHEAEQRALQKLSDLQQDMASMQTAHDKQREQLQQDLAAASKQAADLSTRVKEQQQLLEQQCSRAQDLQVQLDGESNQHAQTRIRLQHEVVQRQTAEESLRHERDEKHAIGEKADGLQLQLTTKTQDLSQLTAEHVATTQTLQQLREGFAELSQLHRTAQGGLISNKAEISSLQEKLAQRDRQLATQDQQLQEAQEQMQQLQQQVSELQQQLDEQLAVAATQEENIEQLIEECTQERAKLADSRQELHAAVTQCNQARERCEALEEQVEQQQRDADLLERQLEVRDSGHVAGYAASPCGCCLYSPHCGVIQSSTMCSTMGSTMHSTILSSTMSSASFGQWLG